VGIEVLDFTQAMPGPSCHVAQSDATAIPLPGILADFGFSAAGTALDEEKVIF
jgi:hypothetical protein